MGLRTIDLFCGAGGSSLGAALAGAEIVAGFDHDPLALAAFKRNHPRARTFGGDIRRHPASAMASELGPVDLILASPECTSHTHARGSRPRLERSLSTAFEVPRFARVFKPRWVVVENVVNMRGWGHFEEFQRRLVGAGYHVRIEVLDSADYGVPQRRRRMFIVGAREGAPPVLDQPRRSVVPSRSVLAPQGRYPMTPMRRHGRAPATLERAARAIAELGPSEPFLMVYYGNDHAGGWQSLDEPLRTITTLDRFAYVTPRGFGHSMRMLQVPELKRAMGLPASFNVDTGCRRDAIRLLGNGVCPPVMRWLVTSLIRAQASSVAG